MKIALDRDACEGHGQCEVAAPGLFRLNDDGELDLTYDGVDIPADQVEAAHIAVLCCPVIALRQT